MPSNHEDFVQLDRATNRTVGNVYKDVCMSGDASIVPSVGAEATEFGFGKVTVEEADRANLQSHLREARSFAQSVAGVIQRTFLLIGGQHATDISLDLRTLLTAPNFAFLDRVTRTVDGDSTVPVVSAEFRSSKSPALGRETFAVDHAKCFVDAAFRKAVIDRCRRLP